ncbi:hypothetical protein I0C86_05235 [Plantactinospora sp. S1510]|uniref:Uncharacterized protein n=1 Tax=Plantactinospora alkalitolerans TaxID=2789879 RepID=A0ABS0GQC8_9ACTN|nr:hypothetical protein [Plantactinospora alkalitolerans]MBF9128396.1 hypothetical protein [Plantactinospora alkalitolerans]
MITQPAGPPAAVTLSPEPEQHGTTVDSLVRAANVPRPPPDVNDDIGGITDGIVDEWGRQSFPASDPPANW